MTYHNQIGVNLRGETRYVHQRIAHQQRSLCLDSQLDELTHAFVQNRSGRTLFSFYQCRTHALWWRRRDEVATHCQQVGFRTHGPRQHRAFPQGLASFGRSVIAEQDRLIHSRVYFPPMQTTPSLRRKSNPESVRC